jgi:hypothetical protein
MKRIILITIFILLFIVIITGCEVKEEPKLSADKVDIIPDVDIDECLTQIRQTNPDMTEQDANNNCLIIEAVNKNDKTLCDRIGGEFRASCFAQFE